MHLLKENKERGVISVFKDKKLKKKVSYSIKESKNIDQVVHANMVPLYDYLNQSKVEESHFQAVSHSLKKAGVPLEVDNVIKKLDKVRGMVESKINDFFH